MTKRLVISIRSAFVLLILVTNVLVAQDEAFILANQFLEFGNNDQAITEFERFIFFNPESELVREAYLKISEAYQRQGNWENSVKALQYAIARAETDSMKEVIKITLARNLLASGSYSNAEFELLRLAHYSSYSDIKNRARFLLGICHLYTFKWQSAQKDLNVYFARESPIIQSRIDSLIATTGKIKYKSPAKAKWLSRFLPGAGQIYASDWRNGLDALALNGILGVLFVKSIIDGRIDDAFIGYFTLLQRYYQGNIYHAQNIATNYNERENKKMALKILDLLVSETNEAN